MNIETLGWTPLINSARGNSALDSESPESFAGAGPSLRFASMSGDGFGHSQDYQVSALAVSGRSFLGQPSSGFGARGSMAERPTLAYAIPKARLGEGKRINSQSSLTKKIREISAKVTSILDKLKALKIPGLANCVNLVTNLYSALEAGLQGDWEACAKGLIKAGKSALSIAKSSGKLVGKVAGRSIPVVSVIVGGWGMIDSKDKANKARKKGYDTAAVLWEIKGACDAACTAMGLLQILTAPTVAMPAGLEAGILTLSLVSELVADTADESEKEEAKNAPPKPLDTQRILDGSRIPSDNTRVVHPPYIPKKAS